MGADCLTDAPLDVAVFRVLVLVVRPDVPRPFPLPLVELLRLPELVFPLALRLPEVVRLLPPVVERVAFVFFCPEAAEVLVVLFF